MPIIGRRHGDGYAEYPCVRRLRHRRLITLLLLQGFETTAESYVPSSSSFASCFVPPFHPQPCFVGR
jgi:hypothetical protein